MTKEETVREILIYLNEESDRLIKKAGECASHGDYTGAIEARGGNIALGNALHYISCLNRKIGTVR